MAPSVADAEEALKTAKKALKTLKVEVKEFPSLRLTKIDKATTAVEKAQGALDSVRKAREAVRGAQSPLSSPRGGDSSLVIPSLQTMARAPPMLIGGVTYHPPEPWQEIPNCIGQCVWMLTVYPLGLLCVTIPYDLGLIRKG
jgi:hypothetical protein